MHGDHAPRTAGYADGYAEVVSIGQLRDWLRFSLITCRHKDATGMHRCARAAMQAILCPCAWNDECIVNAVQSELLCAEPGKRGPASTVNGKDRPRAISVDKERRQRKEELDRALDEALAATFPASDPVAFASGRY